MTDKTQEFELVFRADSFDGMMDMADEITRRAKEHTTTRAHVSEFGDIRMTITVDGSFDDTILDELIEECDGSIAVNIR